MGLAVTSLRMVAPPNQAERIRAWLDGEKKNGERVTYLEVPGLEMRTFIVHSDSRVLKRMIQQMPGWKARSALT